MGYSEDYAHAELAAQGEEFGSELNELSDHEKMCECFGYSLEEFEMLSGNDKRNYKWNWVHVQNRGKAALADKQEDSDAAKAAESTCNP